MADDKRPLIGCKGHVDSAIHPVTEFDPRLRTARCITSDPLIKHRQAGFNLSFKDAKIALFEIVIEGNWQADLLDYNLRGFPSAQ